MEKEGKQNTESLILTRLYKERFFRKMKRHFREVLKAKGLHNMEVDIEFNDDNEIEAYLYNWEWIDKRDGHMIIINGFKYINEIEEWFNECIEHNHIYTLDKSREDYEQELALKE